MLFHSVIAITGLGGHAFDSWRSRIATKRPIDRPMWLRDFLPQQFPNARIMTYGYGSGLKGSYGGNITGYRRSFIQCLQNCRRQCPVRFCLTKLPCYMLIISPCNIETSNCPYRAWLGRDVRCSGRRTSPKPVLNRYELLITSSMVPITTARP